MDASRPVGRHTAAEARGDDQVIAAVAAVTGLPSEEVAKTVATARGATQVRNLFRSSWPMTAAAMGGRNVAFVREYDLRDEVQAITGATRHLVTKRLNASHGRQLVRNLFWDWWPEEGQGEPAAIEARTEPIGEAESLTVPTEEHEPAPLS